MRTTLDIEPDILQVAKDIASAKRSTAGAVLSELAKAGFEATARKTKQSGNTRNGIEALPARGEPVSIAHVQSLMDEEGI